jgi:hypothetical protein
MILFLLLSALLYGTPSYGYPVQNSTLEGLPASQNKTSLKRTHTQTVDKVVNLDTSPNELISSSIEEPLAKKAKNIEGIVCPICLDTPKMQRWCPKPCLALYCAECIENWQKQDESCPVCRVKWPKDSVFEMLRKGRFLDALKFWTHLLFDDEGGDDMGFPMWSVMGFDGV